MKRLLRLLTAMSLAFIIQSCAIYAAPYGYSPGYYGYAPNYGFGFNYWPHSYYIYRPFPHYWGGYGWWGGHHWGGNYGGWHGGGGHWGGHGGWHGR